MRESIENVIEDAFDKIDDSTIIGNDNLENDISNLVHEQNEKIVKEKMKKELINTLDDLKRSGASICYSEDMEYDELEKIVNENQ